MLGFFISMASTKAVGLYTSYRIGQYGIPFKMYKLRTMNLMGNDLTTVTTLNDPRITPVGRWLRKFKIDELPQLWNVIQGDMSLVGPRPDVPGFADCLTGADRQILELKPGITGWATLAFRNEEVLLSQVKDPISYNREVIWPQKIKLNKDYLQNYSWRLDVKIIALTLFSGLPGQPSSPKLTSKD